MNNLIRASTLLTVAVLLASCTNKLVTKHLQPAQSNTSENIVSDASSNFYCIGLNTDPTNPGSPPAHGVWVGYARLYDPGTQPAPCWEGSSTAYRGAVRFDLSPYAGKKVVSAILNISLGTATYISGKSSSNEGVWVKTLGLGTSTWWTKPSPYITGENRKTSRSGLFPWKPIPGMPDLPYGTNPPVQKSFPVKYSSHTYQIDVSSVVRDWVAGKEPNLGFILIGTNEKVVQKNTDTALSPVTSMGLDITYSTPK